LRRRSYAPNADGRFEPEYAEIYGVPFAFLPTDRPIKAAPPARPALEVRALDERLPLRITFPKLDGYRVEVPEEPVVFDHEKAQALYIDRALLATWTETGGMIGEVDEQDLAEVRHARPQQVAYAVAADMLRRKFRGHDGATKPWLFPALVNVTTRWLAPQPGLVTFAPDTPVGSLLLAEPRAQAAEAVFNAVVWYPDARREILLPIIRRFDPEGSTDEVSFVTRKVVIEAIKSPVSHVVLDGVKGNTWEETIAGLLEADDRVAAYVKNDHLGFFIPYVWEGRAHDYLPDFLVRLVDLPEDVTRTLIVEVSGGRKSPGPTAVKAVTARDQWCTAVNNHGGFGMWGYLEITTMFEAERALRNAVDLLRSGAAIVGDPDRSMTA
jgi:type III restriction enzyme